MFARARVRRVEPGRVRERLLGRVDSYFYLIITPLLRLDPDLYILVAVDCNTAYTVDTHFTFHVIPCVLQARAGCTSNDESG